jgi:hypothetical protein
MRATSESHQMNLQNRICSIAGSAHQQIVLHASLQKKHKKMTRQTDASKCKFKVDVDR